MADAGYTTQATGRGPAFLFPAFASGWPLIQGHAALSEEGGGPKSARPGLFLPSSRLLILTKGFDMRPLFSKNQMRKFKRYGKIPNLITYDIQEEFKSKKNLYHRPFGSDRRTWLKKEQIKPEPY